MSFHQVQVLGQAGIARRALCTQCCCLVLHSTISCQGRLQGQERRWASLQQCCCHHSHQDSPLLPFFTHFFQSNLQSPFSVAPLGMLLLHLVDLFLLLRITLCYGLFVLSCFGIYIYIFCFCRSLTQYWISPGMICYVVSLWTWRLTDNSGAGQWQVRKS